MNSAQYLKTAASIQGGYYLLTGLWSLFSISSFQLITGPKTDLWLVKTVGVLVSVEGVVFLVAAVRRTFSLEILLLGVLSALALSGIDLIYVLKSTISPVYLLDMFLELFLAGLWIRGRAARS